MQRTLSSSEQDKYILRIPDDVERTIRTLCACSPNREWSGIMFYNFEGNFADGLVITAKDIFLMDHGSAGHTTTDFSNPEIAQYMVRNKLLGCCMAAIHSHHTLGAFFSGEDQNTLKVEGTDMNNFVSLVVDNKGTYVAAVTRRLTRNTKETIHKDVEQEYPLFNTDRTVKESFSTDASTDNTSVMIEAIPLKIEKTAGIKPDTIIERFGIVSSRPSTDSMLLQKSYVDFPKTLSTTHKEVFKEPTLFDKYNWDTKSTQKKHPLNVKASLSAEDKKEAERVATELLAGTPFTPSTLKQLLSVQVLKQVESVYEKRFSVAAFQEWMEVFVRFEIEELEQFTPQENMGVVIEKITEYIDTACNLYPSEYFNVIRQELMFYY